MLEESGSKVVHVEVSKAGAKWHPSPLIQANPMVVVKVNVNDLLAVALT